MYGTLPDLLISLLRHMLTFVAGIIVARGWVDAETATQLVGALIGLIGLAFSAFFHAGSNGTMPTISTHPAMSEQTQNTTTVTKSIQPVPTDPNPHNVVGATG